MSGYEAELIGSLELSRGFTVPDSFVEHRDLALVLGEAAMTASGSDHGKHRERLESGARDKDALRVGALVGRVDEVSLGHGLKEIGGHESFEDFAVFEAEADPESFGARTRGESLAGEGFGLAELADEIDSLDLAQVDEDDRSGGVKYFDFAFVDELGRGHVTGYGVAVHLANDDFFVRRRHGKAVVGSQWSVVRKPKSPRTDHGSPAR